MQEYEEDPVEAYKREFLRKRAKKKEEEDQATIRRAEKTHQVFRYLSFPILMFAIILLTDKYLPYNIYHETAEVGWQERISSRRRSKTEYKNFMQTKSFVFQVPPNLHIEYPYYEKDKPAIAIAVTRIFKFPIHVRYELNNITYSSDVPNLTLTTYLPLTWLLVLTSLFTVVMKESTPWTYGLSVVPLILLAIVLLGFW